MRGRRAMTAVPIKDVAQLVGGNASFLSIDRQEYAARMDPVFVRSQGVLPRGAFRPPYDLPHQARGA